MIPGDRVRLVSAFGEISAGAEGVVNGYYHHPEGVIVAVIFDEQHARVPKPYLTVIGGSESDFPKALLGESHASPTASRARF